MKRIVWWVFTSTIMGVFREGGWSPPTSSKLKTNNHERRAILLLPISVPKKREFPQIMRMGLGSWEQMNRLSLIGCFSTCLVCWCRPIVSVPLTWDLLSRTFFVWDVFHLNQVSRPPPKKILDTPLVNRLLFFGVLSSITRTSCLSNNFVSLLKISFTNFTC